jgi:murein DD-endopeptidase MepM/ murein hydrolase activator NlpD
MAVKVDAPVESNGFDMKAYLRATAQQELDSLRMSQPKPQNTPDTSSVPSQSMVSGEATPLEGKYGVSQNFGNYNPGLYSGRTPDSRHQGLDIATPEGTPVKSPFAGIVKTGESKDFGKFVEIRTQDGRIMRFSHLKNIDDLAMQLGSASREIQAGQTLGFTGNTGYSTAPHLDVMYQQGGQWTDPLQYDPLRRSLGR